MNITIKSLTGKLIKVNVNKTDTIGYIKERIQEMEGIDPDQQRLVLNGLLLTNDTKISDTKIVSGSVLHMVLALRGGSGKGKPNSNYLSDDSSDENSQLINIHNSDEILYEISFRNTRTTDSNDFDYIEPTINNKKKSCCAIL